MGQSSSMQRIMNILSALNDGQSVCVQNVARRFEVSERTVRRDFELIRDYFGDMLRKEGDCYRAFRKMLLDDILGATDLMTLANIVNLFGLTSMEHYIAEQTRSLLNEAMIVYDFKSRPFERMHNREVVKKLEHAVKFRKETELLYRIVHGAVTYLYRPYKILFLNENFYLIGENVGRQSVEFLRVSMIINVTDGEKTFYADPKIIAFIGQIQTPWASFGVTPTEVKLLVKKKVSKYFLLKKYLPSQELIQKFENGDIEVRFTVHGLIEIEELVMRWLPHVQIIEPAHLKKKIEKVLKAKIAAL